MYKLTMGLIDSNMEWGCMDTGRFTTTTTTTTTSSSSLLTPLIASYQPCHHPPSSYWPRHHPPSLLVEARAGTEVRAVMNEPRRIQTSTSRYESTSAGRHGAQDRQERRQVRTSAGRYEQAQAGTNECGQA